MTTRAWVLVAMIWAAQIATAEDAEVAKLVAALPGKPPEQSRPIIEQLVKTGDSGVRAIIDMLKEPGKGDDSAARTALHALAVYAGAPGHESYRKPFVDVILDGISTRTTKRSVSVRLFLVEQFVFAGRPEDSFPPDVTALLDDSLGGPLSRAIVSVKSKQGVARIRDAIYSVHSQVPVHVTVIDAVQALGDLGQSPGSDSSELSDRRAYRIVATRNWAQTAEGDPDDLTGFQDVDAVNDPYERAQAVDALFLLADRLTKLRRLPEAERIYLHLLDRHKDKPQVQCAAFQGLAQAAPQGVLPMLLAAAEGDRPDVRAAALEAGRLLPGRAVTRAWLKQVSMVSPEAGADILAMLAQRGDSDILEGVITLTRAASPRLRHAAIGALPSLGAENVVAPLIAAMANDSDTTAARDALSRLPGRATVAMTEALQDAKPAVKVALLHVLAMRQATLYQDYVVPALQDPDATVRRAAFETLGVIGNYRVLSAVTEAMSKATDPAERAAAKMAISLLALTEPDPAKRGAALGRVKGVP